MYSNSYLLSFKKEFPTPDPVISITVVSINTINSLSISNSVSSFSLNVYAFLLCLFPSVTLLHFWAIIAHVKAAHLRANILLNQATLHTDAGLIFLNGDSCSPKHQSLFVAFYFGFKACLCSSPSCISDFIYYSFTNSVLLFLEYVLGVMHVNFQLYRFSVT